MNVLVGVANDVIHFHLLEDCKKHHMPNNCTLYHLESTEWAELKYKKPERISKHTQLVFPWVMWLRLWSSPISASLTQMQFNVIVKHDGIYILLSLLVLFSIEFCFKILFQSTASSTWPLCSRCINFINSWSLGLHHCRLMWAQAGQKRRHGKTRQQQRGLCCHIRLSKLQLAGSISAFDTGHCKHFFIEVP